MTLELSTLFLAGCSYLVLLFLIAYATDRGLLPASWISHPLTYTLSLGVYATSGPTTAASALPAPAVTCSSPSTWA